MEGLPYALGPSAEGEWERGINRQGIEENPRPFWAWGLQLKAYCGRTEVVSSVTKGKGCG